MNISTINENGNLPPPVNLYSIMKLALIEGKLRKTANQERQINNETTPIPLKDLESKTRICRSET